MQPLAAAIFSSMISEPGTRSWPSVQADGVFLAHLVAQGGGVALGDDLGGAHPPAPDALALQQGGLLVHGHGGGEVAGVEAAVGEVGAEPVDQRLEQVGAHGQPALGQHLGERLLLRRPRPRGPASTRGWTWPPRWWTGPGRPAARRSPRTVHGWRPPRGGAPARRRPFPSARPNAAVRGPASRRRRRRTPPGSRPGRRARPAAKTRAGSPARSPGRWANPAGGPRRTRDRAARGVRSPCSSQLCAAPSRSGGRAKQAAG